MICSQYHTYFTQILLFIATLFRTKYFNLFLNLFFPIYAYILKRFRIKFYIFFNDLIQYLIFINNQTMRRFIKNQSFVNQFTRNTAVQYRPQKNDQKLRNWTSRLSTLSTQPASRTYLSQLQALLTYYNRNIADTTKEIDWENWNSRIITKGLVSKVRTSFEQFNTQQYDLDKIFNDIFTKDSKALDDINNQMAFHTMVWVDNYADYVEFLINIQSLSNLNDYSTPEMLDFYPGIVEQGDTLNETHNYFAGSKDDINLFMYIGNQFAWGKKVFTFYRHPTDDNKAARATKNTMGR